MNKHIKSLANFGLLSFGREEVVFDLAKYLLDSKIKEEEGKKIIRLKKGKDKFKIILEGNKVSTQGDDKIFNQVLSILEKNCLNEYAVSIRSKKELLTHLSLEEFVRFVFVPVLFEAFNYFKVDFRLLCDMISKTGGEKKFLFFKFKTPVKAMFKNNTLSVMFDNSHFSVKFFDKKFDNNVLDINEDISRFQNNTRDAFFAGLPYTLSVLNKESFDFNINGEGSNLQELIKIVLENLYNYLMIENI